MKNPPVNLNKARKERARERDRRQADGNSASFGHSREQKELAAKRAQQLRARLDAHRVDRGDSPEE